jgi:hypothetical protein
MGVMSADFRGVENGSENYRDNKTRDKDGDIDFKS